MFQETHSRVRILNGHQEAMEDEVGLKIICFQ